MSTEKLLAGIQNQNVRFPEEYYERVTRFTMTKQSGADRNRDNIPFERYVDIWWAALCIGIQEGRRTKVEGKNVPRAFDLMLHNDKNTPPFPVLQGPIVLVPGTETTDTPTLTQCVPP